jgi:curved DNA-binding protein CbpA
MTTPYLDPYAVLGLTRHATEAEIKQAYFALVRANPPEREPEKFKQVRVAYEQLRDPLKRAETDMQLLESWPEPGRQRRAGRLDLTLQTLDVINLAQSLTDLGRTDWREHYVKVKL